MTVTKTAGVYAEFLLGFRDKTKHQGGLYEFVGGKVELGETVLDALKREVCEEVGLTVQQALPVKCIDHDYGDKRVCLHVFWVHDFIGEQQGQSGQEGQRVDWFTANKLAALPMPAANDPIKRIAQLSQLYTLTQGIEQFGSANAWLDFYSQKLAVGAQVYVRVCANSSDYADLIHALKHSRKDVRIIAAFAHLHAVNHAQVVGFHLKQHELMALEQLDRQMSKNMLFFAATHDIESIKKANMLGVDAVTISPVKPTASHANTAPLGLDGFAKLAALANCPVYALGGMRPQDVAQAQHAGAFGVAGISSFI